MERPSDDLVDVEHVVVPTGSIRVLTMHRPAVRNAMDTALLAALVEAFEEGAAVDDLRGVLITGSGGAFSAGADLDEKLPDGGSRRMELFTAVYERVTLSRVPTVAAVEGAAVGGGAELAGACDVRVAGNAARFRFAGAAYGIPIGVARTVGQVGLSVAKDWVLSSRDVTAAEAERRGYVQQLVEDGGARKAALGWLSRTASRDPATVLLLKQLFNEQSGLRDRVAFENDALRFHAETGRLPDLGGALPGTVRPRRR